MNIVERIRISGRCPPSLMRIDSDTDFGSRALKVLDANALHLSVEATVPDDFQKLLEVRWRFGRFWIRIGSTFCNNDVLLGGKTWDMWGHGDINKGLRIKTTRLLFSPILEPQIQLQADFRWLKADDMHCDDLGFMQLTIARYHDSDRRSQQFQEWQLG